MERQREIHGWNIEESLKAASGFHQECGEAIQYLLNNPDFKPAVRMKLREAQRKLLQADSMITRVRTFE